MCINKWKKKELAFVLFFLPFWVTFSKNNWTISISKLFQKHKLQNCIVSVVFQIECDFKQRSHTILYDAWMLITRGKNLFYFSVFFFALSQSLCNYDICIFCVEVKNFMCTDNVLQTIPLECDHRVQFFPSIIVMLTCCFKISDMCGRKTSKRKMN